MLKNSNPFCLGSMDISLHCTFSQTSTCVCIHCINSTTLVPEAFFYYLLANFATQTAFFIFFVDTKRWERWKPLVKIVENLTFMMAQHLTAVKDFIHFWLITKEDIFNPSNHITRRAIKNILQSETTVKSWWHESEVPNVSLDQRLSFPYWLGTSISASRRKFPNKKR